MIQGMIGSCLIPAKIISALGTGRLELGSDEEAYTSGQLSCLGVAGDTQSVLSIFY
jgi:hypothetical protein